MAKKSRTIDKVIDLFEDHELHNMAMIVKDYEEDKKEFEAVYYKIK
ncbi:hypothetical protein [Paenibacillus sp. CFBP13512]|nr:hypothetical protein [Paenibacillus sp. CFBP13512]